MPARLRIYAAASCVNGATISPWERSKAIESYLRAWTERDRAARAALIEACWAIDGRLVTKGREIHGRVALAEEMARLDPQLLRIRRTSVIDAGLTRSGSAASPICGMGRARKRASSAGMTSFQSDAGMGGTVCQAGQSSCLPARSAVACG